MPMTASSEKSEPPFKFTWQRALCSQECPLAPTTKFVGLARSIYMDGDGTNCRPSAKRISEDTGLGVRTVKRADKTLADTGWLVVTQRGGSPRGGVRMATVCRAQIPTTGVTAAPVAQVQNSLTGVTGAAVAQPLTRTGPRSEPRACRTSKEP
jgi:hypothetical protein